MLNDWVKAIGEYFDGAASNYDRLMEPAFGPLAHQLVDFSELQAGDFVLDLGTGTGLAAQAAVKQGAVTVGLDIARSMLQAAQQRGLSHIVQADFHHLPFAPSTFSTVLASFALNSSDPQILLEEVWRVLHPHGWLVIQEWEAADELSEVFNDIFAEYTIENPSPPLAKLRESLEKPIPWDDLESIEDLVEIIKYTGFSEIDLHIVSPTISMTIDKFINYKLAWPLRVAELMAMSDEVRALCLSDLNENLAAYSDRGGRVEWQPNLVRIRAAKATRLK